MASTYGSESQHRTSSPQHDQDEDWSDSASDKQGKQAKSAKRHSKLRHKPAEHYRQHTSESTSQFPVDSGMGQARNATVPYDYNHGHSHPSSYQTHPNAPMQYMPSLIPQAPVGYPHPYTYPGQGGYLSVPRTGIPLEQSYGPTLYGHPSGGYPESGYGFNEYNYDQNVPPPPEYPTQDPLRTPVRQRQPPTQNVQLQRDTSNTYRDKVERKPRRKRPQMPKQEEILPENSISNAEIMEALKKLQQEVKENADVRLDQERQETHRRRKSPPATQSLLDDITALDIERQKTRQLNGIIHRLLEDRWDQKTQDSYAGTSRRSLTDSGQSRAGTSYRETSLMSPHDLQSLESRLDLIIDHLEIGNSPLPQQLPEGHNSRQGFCTPQRQSFIVSDPSMIDPDPPTSSRSPSCPGEYFQPREHQRHDVQASNQTRLRQQPSRMSEVEEIVKEYPEQYGVPRVPVHGFKQGMPVGSKSMGSQSRGGSLPSVGQRSELRGYGKGIVPGDQQKVIPGRDPIVEWGEEQESEGEPVADRTPAPYFRPALNLPTKLNWRKHKQFR